jgi:hypothetical protein
MITGDLIRLFVVAQDLWSLASLCPSTGSCFVDGH